MAAYVAQDLACQLAPPCGCFCHRPPPLAPLCSPLQRPRLCATRLPHHCPSHPQPPAPSVLAPACVQAARLQLAAYPHHCDALALTNCLFQRQREQQQQGVKEEDEV